MLGVEQVGIDDNFFDLGGHSLLVVRAASAADEGARARAIPLTTLFRFPTIRGFVQHLERRRQVARQPSKRGIAAQARREQLSRMRGSRPRAR